MPDMDPDLYDSAMEHWENEEPKVIAADGVVLHPSNAPLDDQDDGVIANNSFDEY